MWAFARAVCACLALVTLGACAGGPVSFEVDSPATAPSVGADGKAFKLEVASVRGAYRNVVALHINGYGELIGVSRSIEPVRDVIERAFAAELAARGIVVDGGQARTVRVYITAMHGDPILGLYRIWDRGFAAFTVEVVDADGAVLFLDTISAVEEDRLAMFDGVDDHTVVVKRALAKAFKALFENSSFVSALQRA